MTAEAHSSGRVVLAGRLDSGGLDALRCALDEALVDPKIFLSIDATDVTFVDVTGITELLRYMLIAAARQCHLYLDRVSPPVAEVLEILDLRHVLMAADTCSAPRSLALV